MKLIEVKILYNADYLPLTDTEKSITQVINWVLHNPDVIHVSKTILLPDGEHDDS